MKKEKNYEAPSIEIVEVEVTRLMDIIGSIKPFEPGAKENENFVSDDDFDESDE